MTLFLDMDGVLADFDKRATEVLGMDSYRFEWRYGTEEFWRRLNAVDDFFLSFDPMPDFQELWDYTGSYNPCVLTALPKGDKDRSVDAQKRQWIARFMGFQVPVITCLTHEKPEYCRPGDILVDDRNKNEKPWKKAGGYFVHHMNASDTIQQLKNISWAQAVA